MTASRERSPSVLVIDDEPALLRLVVRVLEGAGYAVESARDGDEALRLVAARQEPRDAVVVDAKIPPDGAAALLDSIAPGAEGPGVVVISGDWLEPALQERLDAAKGRYLRKPFRPRELLEAVADLVARQGA